MNGEPNQSPNPGFLHRALKFPLLDREARVELADRVKGSSSTDTDFLVMMSLSAILAALGLIQGSTAVVIGAMLVAPLMGPLLGGGLALTQGNLRLFLDSIGTTGIGVALGLGISLGVGLLNPGYEPSLEIEARGNPDLFDLGIAFAAGMAAAYAQGRPNVAASLAGVAIAAALVPPLAVVGIALTNARVVIAANAAILLVTNIVAIVLGAALTFRLLGVRIGTIGAQPREWARRATILLVLAATLLVAPLLLNMVSGAERGADKPLKYPVAIAVRKSIRQYIEHYPGVEVISMGRTSVEPERGIDVVLSSERPLGATFEEGLKEAIIKARGRKVPVEIFVLKSAKLEGQPG